MHSEEVFYKIVDSVKGYTNQPAYISSALCKLIANLSDVAAKKAIVEQSIKLILKDPNADGMEQVKYLESALHQINNQIELNEYKKYEKQTYYNMSDAKPSYANPNLQTAMQNSPNYYGAGILGGMAGSAYAGLPGTKTLTASGMSLDAFNGTYSIKGRYMLIPNEKVQLVEEVLAGRMEVVTKVEVKQTIQHKGRKFKG